MRKLTEPEAHRARAAIVDGRYPEGMRARCGWCGKVEAVREGRFDDVKISGHGPSKAFKCAVCVAAEAGAA